MKMITSSLTGLSSSLLLNVGLTGLAQKLDPVSAQPSSLAPEAHGPALSMPCTFTPKPRR